MVARVGARVGVLALQGDVREHIGALGRLGVTAVGVRRPAELASVDALVLPGGESTAIVRLARNAGMLDGLRSRLNDGMPTYGVCAGMVLLAAEVLDGEHDLPGADGRAQATFGGLDITVRRNAFGRQVASFEGAVEVAGVGPVHGVFIRAPWVERVGRDVTVLASIETGPAAGRIVAVRQGPLLATSFHPELTGDARMHGLFVDLVKEYV